jgi:hypothetical protein
MVRRASKYRSGTALLTEERRLREAKEKAEAQRILMCDRAPSSPNRLLQRLLDHAPLFPRSKKFYDIMRNILDGVIELLVGSNFAFLT